MDRTTNIVELKEKRPFKHGNYFIWFEKGELFEIIEERSMALMGEGYKLKSIKYPCLKLEGYNNAGDFNDVVMVMKDE